MKVTRKDSKIRDLRQAIKDLDSTVGRVGWFPSARHEKGQPVAGIAAVHEFGAPSQGIPPRSFFRPTAEEKRPDWANVAAQISRRVMRGQLPPSAVAEAVSLAAEGDARAAITRLTSPPLAEATVAARRRRLANGGAKAQASIAKPLVDTGIMLATLTSEVETK